MKTFAEHASLSQLVEVISFFERENIHYAITGKAMLLFYGIRRDFDSFDIAVDEKKYSEIIKKLALNFTEVEKKTQLNAKESHSFMFKDIVFNVNRQVYCNHFDKKYVFIIEDFLSLHYKNYAGKKIYLDDLNKLELYYSNTKETSIAGEIKDYLKYNPDYTLPNKEK